MIEEICHTYLEALNEGNLTKVLQLFTENATVHSPLYGDCHVKIFYERLFSDTDNSETQLINTYFSTNEDHSIGLHFKYKWTLGNQEVVEFECVDLFSFDQSKNLFSKLVIIYDTHNIRQKHLESISTEISSG